MKSLKMVESTIYSRVSGDFLNFYLNSPKLDGYSYRTKRRKIMREYIKKIEIKLK